MVRRGKKGRGKGRDNLGGKVEYTTTSALPVSDHLHHRCIPITRRNARAKRHICEVDIQESKQTFTERTWPRSVGGSISQRYERRERVREPIHKYGNEGKEKKMEMEMEILEDYKEYHVLIDSPAGQLSLGVDTCPIPFLNPLTKLRNGSSSQSSAPDGVSTCVLARVRGLVSESSSSDSRCRFFAPLNRAAASTAVASVEAVDNGGRFSDFSERLGLILEALVVVP